MKKYAVLLFLLILLACHVANTPTPPSINPAPAPAPAPAPQPSPTPAPGPVQASIVLDWEANHPERAAWTAALIADLTKNLSSFSNASDRTKFCTKYDSLSQTQQLNVWGEMIVWITYYESSWDPTEASVDVGEQNDPNTWSVGLLQLSVVDQQNYNLNFGYVYKDLQDPIKNLNLGITIMNQLNIKHGKLLITDGNGEYWSTLSPGNQDDQSKNIEKKTQALSFCN